MKYLLVILCMFAVTHTAAADCGSRGGPGFRGPNGKCVGWKQLGKVCGNPPTSRCSYEGDGIGDTDLETGSKFIAAGAAGATAVGGAKKAKAFNERTIKADGIACSSTNKLTEFENCNAETCAVQHKEETVVKECTAKCAADIQTAVKAGECAHVVKGTDITVQAGSHSFAWVRIKVPGAKKELWVERALVLD